MEICDLELLLIKVAPEMCICFESFFPRYEWALGWGYENGREDRKLKKCSQLDLFLPAWKGHTTGTHLTR